MKIQLSKPPLKNWTLAFCELTGDEDFNPTRSSYSECPDSERWCVNSLVIRLSAEHGVSTIFNQERWNGHSGWEFWSSDEAKILDLSLEAAAALGLQLELV